MQKMKNRETLVGFAVVLILVGAILLIKSRKTTQLSTVPTASPSIEKKIRETFKLTIPDDVDKVELKTVSEITGSGIATRKYQAGKFSHMVLADLPDPDPGSFYQGWLVKGDNTYLATGKLRIAKGGYLLEFVYPTDLSDYKKVIVSLEKGPDQKPSRPVLEGSF